MLNLLTKSKIWLAASVFAASASFAQQGKNKNSAPAVAEQGHEMSKSQIMPIYSAPARVDVRNSWDLYVSGKFLYWQAREENLELGLISRNDPEGMITGGDSPFNTTYSNKMKVINPHFTYRPGFKVALGANLDYDNWDARAEYTWFHSNISTGINPLPRNTATAIPPNGQYLYPIQGAAGSIQFDGTPFFFQDGHQSWNLKMDFLDVSLARSYYWGTKLTLRPFFGARGAWIRQHLNTVLNGNNLYEIADLVTDVSNGYDKATLGNVSTSWGVGPRAGFESNWLLGYGTRLIGNGSADILYTRYSLRTSEQLANQNSPSTWNQTDFGIESPIDSNVSVSQEIDLLRTHAEFELGLGWGSYFENNKWHVDFAATYGFQVFWNQNMFRNFESNTAQAHSFTPSGNLYVHGMTLSGSLDF
jgi:hypothetical protein